MKTSAASTVFSGSPPICRDLKIEKKQRRMRNEKSRALEASDGERARA